MAKQRSGDEFGSPSKRMACAAQLFFEKGPPEHCAKLAASAVQEEPTEDNLRLLALYHLHARQLDEAFAAADRLPDSQDPHTQNALGLIGRARQDGRASYVSYRKALSCAPDFAIAYRNFAFDCKFRPFCEVAVVNRVRALVVTRPDGVCASHERDPEDMPRFLTDQAEKNPGLTESNPSLARVWDVCNAIETARNPLPPRTIDSLGKLGELEWLRPALRAANVMRRNWRAAGKELRRALDLCPDEPSLLSAIWRRALVTNLTRFEFDALKRLVELHPAWRRGHLDLVRCLNNLDRTDLALRHLDKLITFAPDYAPAYSYRYSIRWEQGDLMGALADLQTLVRLQRADEIDSHEAREDPLEPTHLFDHVLERAQLLAEVGDRELAEAEFERTLALARELDQRMTGMKDGAAHVPIVLSVRGDCHRKQGRLVEALQDYDAALECDTMLEAQVLRSRAACKEALGDKEGAREDLRLSQTIEDEIERAAPAPKKRRRRKK